MSDLVSEKKNYFERYYNVSKCLLQVVVHA